MKAKITHPFYLYIYVAIHVMTLILPVSLSPIICLCASLLFIFCVYIYIYCLYCERENSFSAAINTYEFQSQPNLQKNVHFCSFLRFFFVLFWKKLMISHFIINFGKFGCMNAGREYGAQLLTTSGAL